MRFKLIENLRSRRTLVPAKIRITTKGTITLNSSGMEKTHLKENDKILIIQDLDKPNDFYMIKTKENEAPILRAHNNSKSLLTNYVNAYTAISKHFKIPAGVNFDVFIGGQIKTELGIAHYLITGPLADLAKKGGNNA